MRSALDPLRGFFFEKGFDLRAGNGKDLSKKGAVQALRPELIPEGEAFPSKCSFPPS
jgi:hypothetical protein